MPPYHSRNELSIPFNEFDQAIWLPPKFDEILVSKWNMAIGKHQQIKKHIS